jgi:hypothetical protein
VPHPTARCQASIGAAGFTPATSRVSGDGTPGRSAHQRAAGVARPTLILGRPVPHAPTEEVPANTSLRDGRGGFRTCDLSRVKGLDGVSGGGDWLYSAVAERCRRYGARVSRTHWARCGHGADLWMASWVRSICSACGSPGSRRQPAVGRRFRPRRRLRWARRPDLVCLWCARVAVRWSAFPAQPGHTQPKSGADRRCQDPPGRAERSESRSGGLDCRRAVELCRCDRPHAATAVAGFAVSAARISRLSPAEFARCRRRRPR